MAELRSSQGGIRKACSKVRAYKFVKIEGLLSMKQIKLLGTCCSLYSPDISVTLPNVEPGWPLHELHWGVTSNIVPVQSSV
jgi:hypothetical protein